jgi:hypothetical protein
MTHKNLNSRCKAIAKSGKPCRAAATEGGLCFFHSNPDKASELGRIGGRGNRHDVGENADPLPILDNATAVRDAVARLIADVYGGKVHPRIAAGLAPLLSMQLRAIETTDLEQRLAKLEKLLAETTVEAEEHLNGKARAREDLANSARENAFSVSDAPESTTKEVAKW